MNTPYTVVPLQHVKKLCYAVRSRPLYTVRSAALWCLLVLMGLQLAIVGVNKLREQSPVLGLRFENTVVGGLSSAEADRRIATATKEHQESPMTIRAQHFTSHATLSQLGLEIAAPSVRQEVQQVGHTGNMWRKLWQQDLAFFGLLNVRLRPVLNNAVANAYISQLEQKINVDSVNASYSFTDNAVVIAPDVDGLTIPLANALQRLATADPHQATPIILPLSHPEAPLTASLLDTQLQVVQNMAAQPITVTAAGYSVTIPPAEIVSAVVPKVAVDAQQPLKKTVKISLDETKLDAAINGIVQQATVQPQSVIIQNGEVVRQGRDGRKLKDTNAAQLVAAALSQRQTNANADPSVDLPTMVDKAPVVYQSKAVVRGGYATNAGSGSGGVHLTFDDGPGAYTQQVLNILARYNVHATFYVIGRNVAAYPADMRRIAAEGHQIGNHSWSHADLTRLSWSSVYQELSQTQTAVQQTAGVTPTRFRPPYGAINNTVRNAAASLGLSVNLWSIDTNDWAQPGSGAITRRALAGDRNGSVILLHVLHQQTVTALPSIIEGIRAQGYTVD